MGSPAPIPMAEVLRAANDVVAEGIIRDYALGGAMAAIFYVEPFATFDIDIFYIPATSSFDAGIPAIYDALQKRGWTLKADHMLCAGFPVQFLGAAGLTEEAVKKAVETTVEGVRAKVFRAEYIIAIAAQVGRAKDKARISQFLEQVQIDRELLREIANRHHISVAGYDI